VSTEGPVERPIERTCEVLVLDTPWWRVFNDEVLLPNGKPGRHLRLEPATSRPGAVVIAERDGAVALVRQYRYAQQHTMWELPRGFADASDVDPLATAARELAEEVGCSVTESRCIGTLTTDSSIVAGAVSVVYARVASTEPVVASSDDPTVTEKVDAPEEVAATEEVDAVTWVPAAALQAMLTSGELIDGFTLAALGLAWAHGVLPRPA
jgi:ADP-ribose pyrophosphatase